MRVPESFSASPQLVEAVIASGLEMVSRSHFASQAIQERIQELKSKAAALRNASEKRALLLTESLDYREFLEEISEASLWIEEHMPMLMLDEPKDEDNVQVGSPLVVVQKKRFIASPFHSFAGADQETGCLGDR